MVVTEKIWTQINGGDWENTDINWWWWLNASILLFVLCPSLSCPWSSSPEDFSCSFKMFSCMCVLCVFSAMPLLMMPTGQCVTEVWTNVSSSPGRVAQGKQVMESLDKLGWWILELVQRQHWGNFWETGWNAYIMGFFERIDTIMNWTKLGSWWLQHILIHELYANAVNHWAIPTPTALCRMLRNRNC